jgi:hypothetical protein
MRGASRFRERELARALRAAKRVGGERVELDPAAGKISVVLGKANEATDANPWDEVSTDADQK